MSFVQWVIHANQLFYLWGSWHNGTRKWFWMPFTLRQWTRTETNSVEYTRDNAWRKFRRNINFIPEFIFCLANMKSGQDGHYNGPNTLLCNISTWANTAIKSRLRHATSAKLQKLTAQPRISGPKSLPQIFRLHSDVSQEWKQSDLGNALHPVSSPWRHLASYGNWRLWGTYQTLINTVEPTLYQYMSRTKTQGQMTFRNVHPIVYIIRCHHMWKAYNIITS